MPGNNCWYQRQHAELTAARKRVAAMDARLRLCRERLAASDEAMQRGDYARAVEILKEELIDER